MIRFLFVLIIIAALAYTGVTGYAGYAVGRQIFQARTKNVFVDIGTAAIGRDMTEKIAITTAHLPEWITESPFFWLMLRATE